MIKSYSIHTHVTNHLYLLIIKLYKVVLYLDAHIPHITIHTNKIITKKNNT